MPGTLAHPGRASTQRTAAVSVSNDRRCDQYVTAPCSSARNAAVSPQATCSRVCTFAGVGPRVQKYQVKRRHVRRCGLELRFAVRDRDGDTQLLQALLQAVGTRKIHTFQSQQLHSIGKHVASGPPPRGRHGTTCTDPGFAHDAAHTCSARRSRQLAHLSSQPPPPVPARPS